MKIQAVIVQNKRGSNLFVVSSHDYMHDQAIKNSKLIFNNILRQFKSGKKIERSFLIDHQLVCVCNVGKEQIILVIVDRIDMFIGYDALKKLTDFFNKFSKLNLPTKKYQEVLLMLEEFLYTRELPPAKLNFNFRPPEAFYSSKKIADCEQLNKFAHLTSDLEINLIANIPLKYAKKQQLIERENDFIELLNRNFKAPYELPPHEIIQKSRAFKYKTVMIEQKKYTQQKPPMKPIATSLTAQKQQLQQYMSISSNDVQMMQQRFQIFQKKNQQTNNEMGLRPVNLLGEEVINQQLQQRASVKSNSVQQKPVKMEMDNNLLDLEYDQKNQIQNPNGSPNKQISQLPHDLVFTQQKNLEIMNISQNLALPNNQIQLVTQSSLESSNHYVSSPSRQNIEVQIKMVEKMILLQRDGKLKEIKMFGQITLEGTYTDDQVNLQLIGNNWNDQHGCQKRITPNSIPLVQTQENAYVYQKSKLFDRISLLSQTITPPKGVIDYIIPVKFFSQQRVPLIFIYKLDIAPNDPSVVSFCLQYKVNDNWKLPVFDVEIEMFLENDVTYEDLKTIPLAVSTSDKIILWKVLHQIPEQFLGKIAQSTTAREITSQFNGNQQRPKSIATIYQNLSENQCKQIELKFNLQCCIVDDMECIMFYTAQEFKCGKRLVVEYKILPNSQ